MCQFIRSLRVLLETSLPFGAVTTSVVCLFPQKRRALSWSSRERLELSPAPLGRQKLSRARKTALVDGTLVHGLFLQHATAEHRMRARSGWGFNMTVCVENNYGLRSRAGVVLGAPPRRPGRPPLPRLNYQLDGGNTGTKIARSDVSECPCIRVYRQVKRTTFAALFITLL